MSCWQAVSKPVWHRPLLCVQWKTSDDGQRNCPKHVQFYSQNKFEKSVHLVGFIIRIYHDERSPELQRPESSTKPLREPKISDMNINNLFGPLSKTVFLSHWIILFFMLKWFSLLTFYNSTNVLIALNLLISIEVISRKTLKFGSLIIVVCIYFSNSARRTISNFLILCFCNNNNNNNRFRPLVSFVKATSYTCSVSCHSWRASTSH